MTESNIVTAIFEPTVYIVIALATLTVAYGSVRSVNTMSRPTTSIDREVARTQREGISMKMAIFLPIFGSLFLLALFFFLDLLFWFYLVLIGLYSTFAVAYVTRPWLLNVTKRYIAWRGFHTRFRSVQSQNQAGHGDRDSADGDWNADLDSDSEIEIERDIDGDVGVPLSAVSVVAEAEAETEAERLTGTSTGANRVTLMKRVKGWSIDTWCSIVGTLLGLTCLGLWIATGNWILHDILALSMAVMMLSFVRVGSIKLSVVLLSLFFIYDIFWVFMSAAVFGENVMLKVATRIQLPVFITVPRMLTHFYSMLGLGDIVLPGLLVCFTRRFDVTLEREARRVGGPATKVPHVKCPRACAPCSFRFNYFAMTLIGYIVGLAMASWIAGIFKAGQPALLYLVPCTLGPVVVRGWRSGELGRLWKGVQKRPPAPGTAVTPTDAGDHDTMSVNDVAL